jgi:tRNA A37 threonylcarbamoyladenosine biosynthesis protein TsaE
VRELEDLGFDDADDTVTIVEWGDVVSGAFGVDRLEVRLDFVPERDDARRITIGAVGPDWSVRVVALCAAVERSQAEVQA